MPKEYIRGSINALLVSAVSDALLCDMMMYMRYILSFGNDNLVCQMRWKQDVVMVDRTEHVRRLVIGGHDWGSAKVHTGKISSMTSAPPQSWASQQRGEGP